MRLFSRPSPCVLLLLGVVVGLAAPGRGNAQTVFRQNLATPQALASHFKRLSSDLSTIHCADTLASLPEGWTIQTNSGHYDISSTPLRDALRDCTSADTERRTAAVLGAKRWFNEMAFQLDSYQASAYCPPNASERLTQILARKEFHYKSRSSLWAQWTQAILQWVADRLGHLLRPVSKESVGYTLCGVLLVAALGAAGWWSWSFFHRAKLGTSPSESLSAPVLHSFDAWLLFARRAAAAHEYARAIHHAYWAAVVWLEGTGALPEDTTRTPRDLLRSLAEQQPDGRAVQPFARLTRAMERFWYAGVPPAESDFRDSMLILEEIGCKLV